MEQISKHQFLKTQDNKRGDDDMMTGFVPCAGDYRESRYLNSQECYYEEPPLDNSLKAKTNIVGYGGYIPGRESENIYGNTWTRTNMNATNAFYRSYNGRNRQERSDPLAMDKNRGRLYLTVFAGLYVITSIVMSFSGHSIRADS